MLLSRGIEKLHDDSFDGSLNEDDIFKDVFFGQENGGRSKKCLVTGAIRFQNDDNTPKNSSFPSTGDDFGSLSEEFVPFKRRKVSVLEHSMVTCRLVESSVHGVKSSCYLLKGHVADQDATKFCHSPGSQEIQDQDSKILVGIQEPVKNFKKLPKDSSFLDLDENQDGKILAFCKSDNISWQTSNVDEGSTIDDQESCRKRSVCSLKDQNNSKFKRQKGKKGKPVSKNRKKPVLKKNKNRKGSCRLLPRGYHHLQQNCSAISVRTVLSWLIDSGVIHQNEVIKYKNPRDNSVIKDGLITQDGILCRCCENMFSVSKFKIHSGFTLNCPCLNLVMESGKALTLCQLEAWSTEYKKVQESTTKTVIQEFDQNDDSCGLCGDGGDLICCDNCPSTFHQECLCLQKVPEGDWYCRNCSCWSCGNLVDTREMSSVQKCLLCKHKYHKECVKETGLGIEMVPSPWFCSESCKEIHSGLDSKVGMMNSISDGFSWTVLRCTHGDREFFSNHHFVAMKVEWNLKLAVALKIMEECFLPMIDPRTGIDVIPHVLYNQGSKFTRLDYEGFYTVVLEKDDMLLSIACIRVHGKEVAEMPLIATCSKYQRQGMCRRLMYAIEKLLKSLKIEKLVLCAIPSLVETWIKSFGFMHLEPQEKRETNLMVFPGTVWLKKPMYQQEIYSNLFST